jgi:hypothetical protein
VNAEQQERTMVLKSIPTAEIARFVADDEALFRMVLQRRGCDAVLTDQELRQRHEPPPGQMSPYTV